MGWDAGFLAAGAASTGGSTAACAGARGNLLEDARNDPFILMNTTQTR